jgi:hypothetical protein
MRSRHFLDNQRFSSKARRGGGATAAMASANVMAITKWANGFGECDGYHKMGDLRLALLNPTDRSHDRPCRM